MLTRHLTNKILDIRLEEEKFYFPGETIKGFVLIHPKSAIKVNSIQLKFSGEVYIHLKEKETNTLFQNTLALSVYPNSTSPKQTTLDASEHSFPFQFVVPKNLNLPSSMEFGKKGYIRYTINALLDRPMIPESLCPKVEYAVSLLEYIDIEKDQFKIPQEKSQDIMLPKAKYNQKCMVRASMPRLGFTRGDIVPLKVNIDHFTSFSRKNGVTVDLVRTVEIRTTKHTVFKETVLRSTQYDMDTKAPSHQQSILCQLLIPTSTPPSIRYKDKVLRFHYKVRVSVSFGDKSTCTLDMPIVIGTWPRAAVPIEDDDDASSAHGMEDANGVHGYHDNEDDDDDDDIESLKTCSVDDQSSVRTSSNILPSWHTNNSSTSTLTTAQRNSIISNNEDLVGRSDSVASKASNRSHNSVSSWKSSRSWEYQQQQLQPSPSQQQQQQYYHHHQYSQSSNNLSRNGSQSTTLSSPDRLPSYYNGSSMGHNRASSVYSTDYPLYNNNINRNSSQGSNGYNQYYNNSRQSMVSLPPLAGPMVQPQQSYNTNRLSRYSRYEEEPPIILENDVPTHILEPLPPSNASSSPPIPPTIQESQHEQAATTTSNIALQYPSESSSDSSSFEDSDDDDDLLAIIERKKKKEQKELRKKHKAEAASNSSASAAPAS
ncbi:Invasin CotH3 [Mucor velutinosus]|uniref:Invasin CotH3 n=1 Tax=Mucor velutinosus TaxID=708070 RepID=A0AAN7D3G0_9FUNG|nr:Invasin CotH3 [Mucor velutinosus]